MERKSCKGCKYLIKRAFRWADKEPMEYFVCIAYPVDRKFPKGEHLMEGIPVHAEWCIYEKDTVQDL